MFSEKWYYKNSSFWHLNSRFVEKTTKAPVFVFITEIIWRTFWRNNWRSMIDVVERLGYWDQTGNWPVKNFEQLCPILYSHSLKLISPSKLCTFVYCLSAISVTYNCSCHVLLNCFWPKRMQPKVYHRNFSRRKNCEKIWIHTLLAQSMKCMCLNIVLSFEIWHQNGVHCSSYSFFTVAAKNKATRAL